MTAVAENQIVSHGPAPNAMTVDVEDYFQVQAFTDIIDRSDWERLPCRVECNVDRLLALFDAHEVTATFFVLGWVAQRYPKVVEAIADAGHEVASHGWEHIPVDRQTPASFSDDCSRTKSLLEDLIGRQVTGYRAATFSINDKTPWAHKVLKEAGYLYSSSVYPIRHDIYGMVGAPRFPYYPDGPEGVVELPITTVTLFGKNLPCGGGGYFRLLPYGISRWAMNRVNSVDKQPCIFFLHPWEIDPDQPRQRNASWKSKFRHYLNLGRTETRLKALLESFAWSRVDEVFQSHI